MQLTLAFLEPSPPARPPPSQKLDAETCAEALNILAASPPASPNSSAAHMPRSLLRRTILLRSSKLVIFDLPEQ